MARRATGCDGITLRLHHVRDDGDADVLDVDEFKPVDEEEHVGKVAWWGTDEYAALREPTR